MAVRVGIIGYGYMGHWHYNRIGQIEGIEVTAVCDVAQAPLTEAAGQGLKVYEDRAQFMADPELDLIVITTPNQFHADYAVEAMKAGKNVICEKPVSMNVAELDRMIEASERTGMLFTVHQNRRWDVDFLSVKQVLESGAIGKPVTIESRVHGERGVVFGWRADPAYGGGMLLDWGVHLIDQILLLAQGEKVISVHAELKTLLTRTVDDYLRITMKFESGLTGYVEVGTFALQKMPRWFIYADRGTMKLDDFTGKTGGVARIKREDTGIEKLGTDVVLGPSRTMAPLSPEQIERIDIPQVEEAPFEYYQNVIESLSDHSKLIVKPEQVRRNMLIVEASFASSEKNETIHVNI